MTTFTHGEAALILDIPIRHLKRVLRMLNIEHITSMEMQRIRDALMDAKAIV